MADEHLLKKLLSLLELGQEIMHHELAAKLAVPCDLVALMLCDLEKLGYLENVKLQDNKCAGFCPLKNSCASAHQAKVWRRVK